MGTHSTDQEGEQEKRVGANTSRVLRAAKCPVITVNGNHTFTGFRSILLPLDLTKESRQKVTMGIEIARYYGAGIKVVSAYLQKNEKAELGKLYQQGEQVTNFIASAGIDCTFEIIEMKEEEKSFVPSMLKYAEKQGDIDLVIILTHQEIGLVEYFVKSLSQDFIRLSDIPVMSIQPKELGVGSSF
jgi:nucleotide-binding universal stress UspA family protein